MLCKLTQRSVYLVLGGFNLRQLKRFSLAGNMQKCFERVA